MIEITSLGIGSNNFGALSTVSFVISNSVGRVLIDCGPDTPKMARAAGYRFVDFSGIVITHKHFDHLLGLPYFIVGRNIEILGHKKSDPEFALPSLTIFCSKEIEGFVRGSVEFVQRGFDFESSNISFDEIMDGRSTKPILELEFEFVPVDHTVPTVGFIVKQGTEKLLCYTSDMVKGTDLVTAARGAKYVICECMVTDEDSAFIKNALHAGVSDAAKIVASIDPKQAFLVHIRPDLLDRAEEMAQLVSSGSGVNARYFFEGEKVKFT